MNSANRGTFYACRNEQDRLEGVALIGHMTLFEAQSEAALAAFARFARSCPFIHVIIGEQEKAECFWRHYAGSRRKPHLTCREMLMEQRRPIDEHKAVPGLRRATLGDLAHVVSAHAETILETGGVNPLEVDPVGFRLRTARRIERERVWVWIKNRRLIFKADVAADTPEVNYLEGIYVNPAERGKGYGLSCFKQLSRTLLTHTKSVCLLVNEQNQKAQGLYRKAGYQLHGYYHTIFSQRKNA